MKLTDTEARDGLIVIGLEDNGVRREISLTTIHAADLIGALRAALENAVGAPAANSMGLPGMVRVEMVEGPQELFFRIYMSEHVFHEYPVPNDSTFAEELKRFSDRMEALNSAQAKNSKPDSPWDKN